VKLGQPVERLRRINLLLAWLSFGAAFVGFLLAVPLTNQTPVASVANETHIQFSVEREAGVPVGCVIVRWQVDQIREVYLDGNGVIGSGERRQCGEVFSKHTLHVLFRDNTTHDYTVAVLPYSTRVLTVAFSLVAALAWLLVSAIRAREHWWLNAFPGLAVVFSGVNLIDKGGSSPEWLGLTLAWGVVWGISLSARRVFRRQLDQPSYVTARLPWLSFFLALMMAAIASVLVAALVLNVWSILEISALPIGTAFYLSYKTMAGFLLLVGALLIGTLLVSRSPGSTAYRKDVAFLVVLLLLPSTVLILLRGHAWLHETVFMSGVYLCWLIICVGWLYARRSGSAGQQEWRNARSQPRKGIFLSSLALAGLILAFTVVTFYIPMLRRFWTGMDEGYWVSQVQQPLWSDFFDNYANRPMVNLGVQIAYALSPKSVDGYLWLAFILRFGTALFTAGSILEMLPRSKETKAVALLAALLFIANPSEVSRFLVISLPAYHVGIFALSGAVFLYLYSYRTQRRSLLLISCVLLGISLLSYETGFPIAAFAAFLPWIRRREGHLRVWTYAWIGTWAVLATRFVVYLWVGGVGTYQAVAGSSVSINTLLYNLRTQLLPTLYYFRFSIHALAFFLPWGLIVFLIAMLTLWRATDGLSRSGAFRQYGLGLLVVVVMTVLGVAPYFVLAPIIAPDVASDLTTFRTQYYAAPVQAAFYALMIVIVGKRFVSSVARLWYCLVPAVLIMLSVANTFRQQTQDIAIYPGVRFENVAYIFDQVDRLVPDLPHDTAVFFVLDDKMETPFGGDYPLLTLSCARLGVPAYSGNYKEASWLPRGAGGTPQLEAKIIYSFNKVIAFRVEADGSVIRLNLPPTSPHATVEINAATACESWGAIRQRANILRYAGANMNSKMPG
jgi:hypothetical protein